MLSNKPPKEKYKSKYTYVTLLLDMSGSMHVRRSETINEVNRYLDNLKSDGQKYKVTVTVFNERVRNLISNENIQDVGELEREEYAPNGWTRLLDAVGGELSSGWVGENSLFVVITDGQENDSRNYGLHQVRDLIDRKRNQGVQFVFLGDGPSAWQVGSKLGFNISVSTDWNSPLNTENIYKSLYTASNSMALGGPITTGQFNTSSTSAHKTAPTGVLTDQNGDPMRQK